MKAIIFIEIYKSGSSREAAKAANRLGFFTIVFTNRARRLKQSDQYPEVHQMILVDTQNLKAMRKKIKVLRSQGREIAAIVSFTDPYVHTAAVLADEFCQSCVSTEAIHKMEDKVKTRLSLKDQPFTPNFIEIKPTQSVKPLTLPSSLKFPAMVKSPKSTGSKDALLAENEKQLLANVILLREKYPMDSVLIEEFIDGEQYLVEALVYRGKVMISAVVKQEITKGERFIVTGYGLMAKVPDDLQKSIEETVNRIISAIGMENGSLHLELRLSNDGWKLIEINPRISGGSMNRMIEAAFGYSLVEQILKLYLGEEPSLTKKTKNFVYTQYIIATKKGKLRKITGRKRARKSPGVVHVHIKPRKGSKLVPPQTMGHRLAYVIAYGSTLEEAKKLAKKAAKKIKFHLDEE
ncbi:biotin carboxylase [Bacillus sp. FJAT-27231]|uniref:ATP-grasp domain-containing protein n=1 Tax=Bacillus sp. FJAT-27231 TaxID=1679168 RepID=UPI00067141D8|nr:ATP-grasp domain-containing protein [Bacillus sp. FJAT-27231]KMY54971.1 biotin carboxylase [Bacillus sp. FJAT-27231]